MASSIAAVKIYRTGPGELHNLIKALEEKEKIQRTIV
jgi:hypothetical protein